MPQSTNQVLELTELPSTMTLPGLIQHEGSTNHVEERPSLLSPDEAQRQRDASHARSESTTVTTSGNSEDEPPFTLRTQKEIGVGPRQDRLVSRRLKGINIFVSSDRFYCTRFEGWWLGASKASNGAEYLL